MSFVADEIASQPGADPTARLIGAQRLAVQPAEQRGLDPDAPRSLSRSIVLDGSR